MKIENYIGRKDGNTSYRSGKVEYNRITTVKENKNKDSIVINIKITLPKNTKLLKKSDEQSDKRYSQCLEHENPENIDKFGILINKILKLTDGPGVK